jgi:hypothetical protein
MQNHGLIRLAPIAEVETTWEGINVTKKYSETTPISEVPIYSPLHK